MREAVCSISQVDRMFRAFADRSRLRILHLLQGGSEMCVGDIHTILELPQPLASRHLAYLRKTGLVKVRRSRQWNYYSLSTPGTPFHRKLIECLSCCFTEVPELKTDAIRAKKLKKEGGCCPK